MMNGGMRKAAWSLLVAAIIALVGWVVKTTSAIATLESESRSIREDISEIKEAVRSIHETFIGSVPRKE